MNEIAEQDAAELALAPKLTDAWLAVLSEAVRVYGWSGDEVTAVQLEKWCRVLSEQKRPIDELIEASSLGTPAAKAARASVSDAVVAQVLARADELRRVDRVFVGHGRFSHGAADHESADHSSRAVPRFCPGCGVVLADGPESRALVPFWSAEESSQERDAEPEGPCGWDCYCPACGWSGDISPDETFGASANGEEPV